MLKILLEGKLAVARSAESVDVRVVGVMRLIGRGRSGDWLI